MAAMHWTHAEIQELLEITLKYKREKSRQNIDWRSHPSTYRDIWTNFLRVYPVKQAVKGKAAFQHEVENITRARVIFKLKDMKRRFGMAKQLDRPGFYARFWDICEKIWEEKTPVHEEDERDEEPLEDEDSPDASSGWDSDCTVWSSTESEDEQQSPPCKRKIQYEDNTFRDLLREYKEEALRQHQEIVEDLNRFRLKRIQSIQRLAEIFKTFPRPGYQQQASSSSPQNVHLDPRGSDPEQDQHSSCEDKPLQSDGQS